MTRRSVLGIAALTVTAAVGAHAQQEVLTLERALALARERSPALAAATAEVRGADGRLRAVRALYAPRVNADALSFHVHDPPSLALGPVGSFSPVARNGYLLQVSVLQPLYTGGRIGAAVSGTEWAHRAASAAREQAEVELTAAVAHAYDAALLAAALLGVAEEGVRVLRSAVAVAEEQHAAGAVARLDVLRAETRLAAAEQEVRAAAEGLAAARERLAVLIGLDPASAAAIAGLLTPAEVALDTALLPARVTRARQGRPDLRALAAGAEAARTQARSARAALRPTVYLYAAGLATRPEFLSERESWSTDFLGGVVVSWPVFDFGRTSGEVQAARSEAERLEAEARQLADAATAKVRAELRNLQRAALDIEAGRENVRRSERALELAQERYAEGVGIQLEVLEAETDLSRTRATLLRAVHDQRSAAIELRRAVGLPADAALPTLPEGR